MQHPKPAPLPPTYRLGFAEQARKFALAGATDEEMAREFGIPLAVLHEWLKSTPEFAEAVHYGRTLADDAVIEGMRQIAQGCFREVVTKLDHRRTKLVTYIRCLPPNRAARDFWERNRPPGEWCRKAEIEPEPSRGSGRAHIRGERQRLITGITAAPGPAPDE